MIDDDDDDDDFTYYFINVFKIRENETLEKNDSNLEF